MGSRRRITLALVGLVVLVVAGWFIKDATGDTPAPPPGTGSSGAGSSGAGAPGAESGLPVKPLSALPGEAGKTWTLIQKGGPYPHSRDGVVFENREKRLPGKQSGYYHEYTVVTPQSSDRGARRLVVGTARELYYTGDHYATFVLVDPGK